MYVCIRVSMKYCSQKCREGGVEEMQYVASEVGTGLLAYDNICAGVAV